MYPASRMRSRRYSWGCLADGFDHFYLPGLCPGFLGGVAFAHFKSPFWLKEASRQLAKFYPLGEGHLPGPVNRAGLAAHVCLPGVRARFPAAPGLLFAPEGPADFGPGGADVHICNATIAPAAAQKQFGLAQIVRKDRGSKSLWYVIVESNGLIDCRIFNHVEYGGKGFPFLRQESCFPPRRCRGKRMYRHHRCPRKEARLRRGFCRHLF